MASSPDNKKKNLFWLAVVGMSSLLSVIWMGGLGLGQFRQSAGVLTVDRNNGKGLIKQSSAVPEWDDFCRENSTSSIRCQKMALSQTKFSYVHISKTGGVSWIRELRKLMRVPEKDFGWDGGWDHIKAFLEYGLYPLADAGLEHGVFWQDNLLKDYRPFHRLATLRSPRHHIFSMFRMCYYSRWGEEETESDPHFPRGHDELTDFEFWLDEFLDDDKGDIHDEARAAGARKRNYTLHCYNPANFQARALMSNDRSPGKAVIYHTPQEVENVYWSFDWVSLTSFFHESKCLLYYRLDTRGAGPQQGVPQMVLNYLNQTCHCNIAGDVGDHLGGLDIKFEHTSEGKKSTLLDFPPSILHKMDILSRIDTAVYQTALNQFIKEIVWLESKLGHRVLCDPVLDKWGKELSYLPLLQDRNLSNLYNEMRRSAPSFFKED